MKIYIIKYFRRAYSLNNTKHTCSILRLLQQLLSEFNCVALTKREGDQGDLFCKMIPKDIKFNRLRLSRTCTNVKLYLQNNVVSQNFHWSRVQTNCEFEANLGQPHLLNKPISLDNVLFVGWIEMPSYIWNYPQSGTILVSWAIDIRGQTVRCVRARGARLNEPWQLTSRTQAGQLS